jgi:homeobox-leucine zipper protein
MHAVITSVEGRKSMLKLAERMVASFCGGVTASVAHQWTTLSGSGAEDVRVMTRKSVDDPGRPPGIVLNAATSFWLPVTPTTVFDFLRDETSRSEVRFFGRRRRHIVPGCCFLCPYSLNFLRRV